MCKVRAAQCEGAEARLLHSKQPHHAAYTLNQGVKFYYIFGRLLSIQKVTRINAATYNHLIARNAP